MKNSLLLFLTLVFSLIPLAAQEGAPARAQSDPGGHDEFYRLVFFAVLEGLYEDGVSTEEVNFMLFNPAPDKQGYHYFVYACPICMPTVQALEVYRLRPAFYGDKRRRDTLGSGLSAEIKDKLKNGGTGVRLGVIGQLVEKWVKRKLDAMRLTEDEKKKWSDGLEERKKQGAQLVDKFGKEGSIKFFAPLMQESKGCAACSGAARACPP